MIHYNIAKKTEVNPFEQVQNIILSDFSIANTILKPYLDNKSNEVKTIKRNNKWIICYDIKHLDFITLLKWIAPLRGKFYFNNHSIEFKIEDDTMICW